MSGWKSIKTAPRAPLDKYGYGPAILMWTKKRVGYGFWDRDFDKWYVEFPEGNAQPTHWMPLPKPPR